MLYNYTPLWDTLKQKGLSRKLLREALQLSPATMARMSSGEPIATETLGRICDFLQCSLDKIFTISPKQELPGHWSSIDNANTDGNLQTFRIYMYFMLPTDYDDDALYLYGYAKPFTVDETNMEIWYVTCDKNMHEQFCIVDGTLYANDLRRFLDAAMNQNTVGDIFQLLKLKTEPVKNDKKQLIKAKCLETILKARIANGHFIYRPPFLLPPENACIEHTAQLMPLLSYEEETIICESLHGTNKRNYYFSKAGIDAVKAKQIWTFLAKMLPFHNNLNEMARLGNFEVLTCPNKLPHQPVKCEIWRDNDVQKGAKVTVNKQLSGTYIARVRLLNGRNPILDNSYIIKPQNEEENPVFIPLNEEFFFAELELWNAFPTNHGQRLLYQSYTPYMRQVAVNMSVLERSMTLEDRWSQAMKKQGKKVNTNVTFFSTESDSPLVGWPEEPWLIEERSIQRDYHRLFGDGKPMHNYDAFFPKGTDNALEFLSWLNERLKSLPKTKRVLLFDPYINDTAIVKFIHNINNIKITYEIITDSCPAGKEAKRKNEINDIKKLSFALANIITPCNLTVRTMKRKDGTLHDRVLMIVDSEQAIVYMLSNSLDNMAKDHSSIVTAVKPDVAQEILNSYVQLVSEAEEKHLIETIFNTKDSAPDVADLTAAISSTTQNTDAYTDAVNPATTLVTIAETDDTCNQHEKRYTKETFINDYGTACTKKALNSLAFMYYDEIKQCFEYVLSLDKNVETQRLQTILNEIKDSGIIVRNSLGIYVLNQNILVKKKFDFSGRLIEAARNAIGWCFEYGNTLPYEYAYAIEILWQLSPENYIHFLEELVQVQTIDIEAVNAKPTPQSVLIYVMVVHITKELSFSETADKPILQALANSGIAYLRALFAAKIIWLPEQFLNALRNIENKNYTEFKQIIQEKCAVICDTLSPTEARVTLIQLIVNLQIAALQNTHQKELLQSLAESVAAAYVKTQLINKKSDTNCLIQQLAPLNRRDPYIICQIAEKLHIAKHINAEQHYEILLHFWKLVYIKENGKEKDYYNEETIQRSNLLADRILKNGNIYAEKLLKEINKQSRNLCPRLYDPLLYSKNYTSWKLTVDRLASLFVTERYLASKNPAFSSGKGETEFIKLTQNYEEILNDYSVTYKIWKKGLVKKLETTT